MPRSFLGLGLLCLCLIAESAWARRLSFVRGSDGRPTASIQSRLLDGPPTGLAPVEVELRLSGLDVEEAEDGFHRLSVEGLDESGAYGEPALLSAGVLVAAPPGFQPHLEILATEQRDVGDVYVAPRQRLSRCRPGARDYAFSAAVYESAAAHPAQAIALETVGQMQGMNLYRVALNPLQAKPAVRSLQVTTSLKARVSFERTGRAAAVELPAAFHELLTSTVANGEGLGQYARRSTSAETMVIIAADSLKGSLGSLLKWMTYRGVAVQLLSTTEAGGTKERIQATLAGLYSRMSPKPSYLLMVGNEHTVPAWFQRVKFDNQTAVTDYPYALLSGNDMVPDILHGRLVADNAAELKVQVDRLIQYEVFPERGASWYRAATTLASREGNNPGDKDYAESIEKILRTYQYGAVDRFFEADGNATSTNIAAALQQGRSWLNYFGHGNGTAWQSTNGDFSVNEVARLQNYGRLPVIFDVACQNGNYVDYKPAFGKMWMTAGNGVQQAGAAAYYGGSVYISWHPPAIMAVGIARSHFERRLASVGASVLAGQLYLMQQSGAGDDARDNLTWYNLFGNPALFIRTGTPLAYKVESQTSGKNVVVKTTDASGRGVGGIRAAALLGGRQVLGVGITDKSGQAVIPVSAGAGADLAVATTGYNAEVYLSAVKAR